MAEGKLRVSPGAPGLRLRANRALRVDAPWFFKATGPRATMEANRGAFETMVRSLHTGP